MPFVSLLVLGVLVFSLVDIIRREDFQVKHLPKMMWIIIVILLPIIGSLLWFTLGRVYPEDGPRMPRPAQRAPAPPPQAYRPASSTEQQLADLEKEIEEERLRAELARRRREQSGDTGA